MSRILKGLTEAKITDLGPGDEATWPAYSGHPNDPRDPPKRRGRAEPDYDSEPYDPWDDHYRKQDAAQKKYKSEVNVQYSDKEGVAPNGKRYNSTFLVKSKTPYQGDNEIYKFNDAHWGAKNIVDTEKKNPEKEGDPYLTMVYYVDNHKHGYWKPWKDEPPISKGVQFEAELMYEGISEQDLADVLFHRLELKYPDIVSRHGHEVVGDAVADVASFHAGAEELGTSDISIMIKQVLQHIERRGLDEAQGELDPESALQQARKITSQFKYADMHMDIITKIQLLAEKSGVDRTDLEYLIDDVFEKQRALESAIFSLDEPFEEALRKQQWNDEEINEDLRKWFKEKWVRFGPDGKIRGDCARGDDSEGKPKCLPQSKAHSLGKKGRASAAARKRREDPNPERSGKAINVNTKKKSNEGVAETVFKNPDGSVRFVDQKREKPSADNMRGSIFRSKPGDQSLNIGDFFEYGFFDERMGAGKVLKLVDQGQQIEVKLHNGQITKLDNIGTESKNGYYIKKITPSKTLQAKLSEDLPFTIVDPPPISTAWRISPEGKEFLKQAYNDIKNTLETEGESAADSVAKAYSDAQMEKFPRGAIPPSYHSSLTLDIKKIFDRVKEEHKKSEYERTYRDVDVSEPVYMNGNDEEPVSNMTQIISQLKKHWPLVIKFFMSTEGKKWLRELQQTEFSGWGIKEILLYIRDSVKAGSALDKDSWKQNQLKENVDDSFKYNLLQFFNKVLQRVTKQEQLDELKCWPGYTRVQGVPAGAPGSCKKKTSEDQAPMFTPEMKCPHCNGEMVSEELINEKKDACYYKVKSRYKVWPSAYASGALVKCRKKGASNWGNKSESIKPEKEVDENLTRRGFLRGTAAAATAAGLGAAGLSAMPSATSPKDPIWDKLAAIKQNVYTQRQNGDEYILNVVGPNTKGEYRVRLVVDDNLAEIVTKTPPKNLQMAMRDSNLIKALNENKPKRESAIMKGLVDETLGTPYPGTYEQETSMIKRKGPERITAMTNEEQVDEKWSQKYKRSIDCNNPKGFSQKAHCQGRKK